MKISSWQELYDAAESNQLDPLETMVVLLIHSFLASSKRRERWAWIDTSEPSAAQAALTPVKTTPKKAAPKNSSKSAPSTPRHDRNSGPAWTREPATEPQRRKLYAVSKGLGVEQEELASDALGKVIDSADIDRLTKGEMSQIFKYAEEQGADDAPW